MVLRLWVVVICGCVLFEWLVFVCLLSVVGMVSVLIGSGCSVVLLDEVDEVM